MHAPHNPVPGGAPPPQKPTPIRVVILYENPAIASLAKDSLHHVANSFQNEFAFEIGAWSFGMFRASQLRDVVMEEASEADLILIAVEAQTAIPSEVMTGITSWCGLKGQKPKALAWLANTRGTQNAGLPTIRSQLQLVANEKSVEVLFGELGPGGMAPNQDTAIFRQTRLPLPVLRRRD